MPFPSPSLFTVALLLGVTLLTLAIQPSLLGFSAALVGEERPAWLVSLGALVVAVISSFSAQVVYAVTLGWVVAKFGQAPLALGALGVNLLVTGIVYSAFLRVSVARGALVAAIYWSMSAAWLVILAVVGKLLLS